jgi:hypothetical protein
MKNALKKPIAATVALMTSLSLCLPAVAGQGGGMSMRSMGGGTSRSMGSGMSSRSMGGSSMSSRSMSMPRGMSSGSFSNSARNIGGAAMSPRSMFPGNVSRSSGGSFSRNLGSSIVGGAKGSPGGLNNIVRGLPNGGTFNSKSPINGARTNLGQKLGGQLDSRLSKTLDRGNLRDVTKGNLSNIVGRGAVKDLGKGRVGELIGSKDLAGRAGSVIAGSVVAGSLKTGRIRTGDLAKIDRSKLRDLVRGIESGKGGIGGLSAVGGRKGLNSLVKGFDKAKFAGAIQGSGLKPFNSAHLLGGKHGFKSKSASILAAACFPHHHGHHHHGHHGHHGHWFDFCFGDFWFDYHYDYCHYEPHYYDPCWYPVYTYPVCGVTFTPYPEVVTVATTQPIMLDTEITLAAAMQEVETAKPVVEEEVLAGTDELDAIFGDTAGDNAADDSAADDSATDDNAGDEAVSGVADETATEENETQSEATLDEATVDAAIAETRPSVAKPVDPSVQPDMDLELINVEMVNGGDREAGRGPSFKVTVRNTGKRNLEKFLVSLVACKDAQIDSNSVHASTTVDELAAGAETSIFVTLPLEAMSLGRDAQGRQMPYKSLVAAVDSDERISEGNEENNLALIDRTSIQLANN